MMSLRALVRPIILAMSLLAGLGQSVDALAHGLAHAHEAEHRGEVLQPEARVQHQHDHHHDHLHAIVDAGLKSRADLVPFLVAQLPAVAVAPIDAVEQDAPRTGSPAPPPERQHTSASPRAPPAR